MTPGAHGEFEEVDNYTNHDMVEKAFEVLYLFWL